MEKRTDLQLQILDAVRREGPITSKQIQQLTGASQPSVSRAIVDLGSEISKFGAARSTTYAIHVSIHGDSGSQAVFNVDERGRLAQVGRLDLLAGNKVRLELGDYISVTKNELPWVLSPLKLEGFLGRLQAHQLMKDGWDANPERWSVDQDLAAALLLYDVPGSLILGEVSRPQDFPLIPEFDSPDLHNALDQAAEKMVESIVVGSSAGGEQPKFLARQEGKDLIVKFSPPLTSPYGERWSDLLVCEAISSGVLDDFGYQSAVNHAVITSQRAFLLSERFDRVPNTFGRHHVVSLGAAHKGLLQQEPYRNWGASAVRLAQSGMLNKDDARAVQTVLEFGRLIGNTDMHSGNLAFFVDLNNLRRQSLSLAPVYDMLPMRWRPNVQQRDLPEYTPFSLDERSLSGAAAPMALEFWDRVSLSDEVSNSLRQTAQIMRDKVADEMPSHEITPRQKM